MGHHATYVFSDDVKFDIDNGSLLDVLEVGMFVGIRDNGNREGVFLRIADSEACAVDSDGSFFYGQISLVRHLLIVLILESE